MNFINFRDALATHFTEMSRSRLFVVDTDPIELWHTYLKAFPPGSDPLYRTTTQHDCTICRRFIRAVGNVVTIKDGKVTTLWDFVVPDNEYRTVVKAMAAYVRSKPIKGIFLSSQPSCGELTTFGDDSIKYDHFHVRFGGQVICHKDKLDTLRGDYRSSVEVFHRALETLASESIQAVLELIGQNTLYRGEGWQAPLQQLLAYKQAFSQLNGDDRAGWLFAWEKTDKAGPVLARIRNHSIGLLLTDLSEGMDIEQAVRRYEAIVAPTNYKRPKAIFTKKMLEAAKAEITQLGYMESIGRRHANLNDISVRNILFCNRDAAPRVQGGDIFAEMSKEVKKAPLKLNSVEEIPVEQFINGVLPLAKEVEVYVDPKHHKNLVSLLAPAVREAPSMFKWNNAFSWAYTGNVTDSMKERVKAAGGNVTGDLRFSIQWNDVEDNRDDLDAHCKEPSGRDIYFGSKCSQFTGGCLDVDIITPKPHVPAVENITWAKKESMVPGTYIFFVHQFSNRGGRGGFRAEIEFDGTIYHYESDGRFPFNQQILVAEVRVDSNHNLTLKDILPSSESRTSTTMWGVPTHTFVPVSVVMFSPDYWDGQRGNGNRHYFFMLKGCVNDSEPNGFYNEFLKPELEKHRHVFEALGAKARVGQTEDQLSGLGFSSTRRESLIVKVKGQTERVMKVVF